MEDFSRHWSIDGTLSVLYCLFWILSPAGGDTLSVVAGSRVVLPCDQSNDTLLQVTWRMNAIQLISFSPEQPLHVSREAARLKINISLSQSELYALVIESARSSHTGNYTCEITTPLGLEETRQELIITEPPKNWNKRVIAMSTAVPCVCCLIFIFTFTVLNRVCSRRGERNNYPTTVTEQTEDIYENCLEINVRHQLKRQSHQHGSSPM